MKAVQKALKAEPKIEIRETMVRSPMQTGEGLGVQVEKVAKNIRHDVLEYEFACKRIDEAQKIAGDRLLALIHRAGIGGAQAIDYQTPKVDGGGKADTLTNAVADAHKRLAYIRRELKGDYLLLEMAIGGNRSIKDIAREWRTRQDRYRPSAQNAEIYIAQRFRDALDELVGVFGIARGKQSDVRVWKDHTPLHFGA